MRASPSNTRRHKACSSPFLYDRPLRPPVYRPPPAQNQSTPAATSTSLQPKEPVVVLDLCVDGVDDTFDFDGIQPSVASSKSAPKFNALPSIPPLSPATSVLGPSRGTPATPLTPTTPVPFSPDISIAEPSPAPQSAQNPTSNPATGNAGLLGSGLQMVENLQSSDNEDETPLAGPFHSTPIAGRSPAPQIQRSSQDNTSFHSTESVDPYGSDTLPVEELLPSDVEDDYGNKKFKSLRRQRRNQVHGFSSIERIAKDKDIEKDRKNGWYFPYDDADIDNPNKFPTHIQDVLEELPPENGVLTGYEEGKRPTTPEDFFDHVFDKTLWKDFMEGTNAYFAQKRQNKSHGGSSRWNNWADCTEDEIKKLFALIIVMGLVRKADLPSYWSTEEMCATPFFRKVMTRNRFLQLYWNLHMTQHLTPDDEEEETEEKHVLHKIKPMLDKCNTRFREAYQPGRRLSYDEASCAFKGRVAFLHYNKHKPAKYHIMVYTCSEASGYTLGLDPYFGDKTKDVYSNRANKNEKILVNQVMGHLEKMELLDKGYFIFMDNYYSSITLFDKLLKRKTFACGTIKAQGKWPLALPTVKKGKNFPKGEVRVRRRDITDEAGETVGSMLATVFYDRKSVCLLSTIHLSLNVSIALTPAKERYNTSIREKAARYERELNEKKKLMKIPAYRRTTHQRLRVAALKKIKPPKKLIPDSRPHVVFDYNFDMAGPDHLGQLMESYDFLRPTLKWSKKFTLWLFSCILVNAYLLNTKFGAEKELNHTEYRKRIVYHLLKDVELAGASIALNTTGRLGAGKHYLVPNDPTHTRKAGQRDCAACNFKENELKIMGFEGLIVSRRRASMKCMECGVTLCTYPCFFFYHTEKDFREKCLEYRRLEKN